MTPSSYDLTPLFVLWGVTLLVGIAAYVWYAVMLAKVFARLGTESWKAWVPLLNEAEILRLGGVPPWSVVFYLVPVVQFYGLYLKAVAASRLNTHFGRGAGSTALAIVLPPVWATLLAQGAGAADPALQERIASSVTPRSGYAFAVSTPQPPEPLTPAPAAGVAPPPLVVPPAPPAPPAVPAAAAPATPILPPPPPALITPPPGIITPPPGLTTPPPLAAAPPVAPAELPAQPWAPLDRPPVASPPAAQPPAAEPPAAQPSAAQPPAAEPPIAPEDAADELDRTVVVDRRPVVPWRLVVDGGGSFRLTASRITLGRRPDGAGAGGQELAVPDATRTLSKVHARLELADGAWTVTDLNATNGVIVIEADGTEHLLEPGASAPVTDRFVLGKVGMRIAAGEDDATP